jgi:hypothetical protein
VGAQSVLSDGGHVENLGIYELLRRRCKYIIAFDAEEDPKVTFGSFAKLIQYARIDGGIEIDIDLSKLRKNDQGLCQCHYAVGKIHYGDDGEGMLVYIKASICKAVTEDITEYRTRQPSFPHESTREQFFNEGQFEAYRALGYHCISEMIRDTQPARENDFSFELWISELTAEKMPLCNGLQFSKVTLNGRDAAGDNAG